MTASQRVVDDLQSAELMRQLNGRWPVRGLLARWARRPYPRSGSGIPALEGVSGIEDARAHSLEKRAICGRTARMVRGRKTVRHSGLLEGGTGGAWETPQEKDSPAPHSPPKRNQRGRTASHDPASGAAGAAQEVTVPGAHSSRHAERPRSPSMPSQVIRGTIARAATGSAHHHPARALSARPPNRITER